MEDCENSRKKFYAQVMSATSAMEQDQAAYREMMEGMRTEDLVRITRYLIGLLEQHDQTGGTMQVEPEALPFLVKISLNAIMEHVLIRASDMIQDSKKGEAHVD